MVMWDAHLTYMWSAGWFWLWRKKSRGEKTSRTGRQFDMVIGNTYFKKDHGKLISYKSGRHAAVAKDHFDGKG